MTNTTETLLWEAYEMFDIEGMNYAAFDIKEHMDALAAKLAEVEAERDHAQRRANTLDEGWKISDDARIAAEQLVAKLEAALVAAPAPAVDPMSDPRVVTMREALYWYADDPSSQGDVARAALEKKG